MSKKKNCKKKNLFEKQNILFLDFETTSLDLKTLEIIEFGYFLTNTQGDILEKGNFLIKTKRFKISQEITSLTNITQEMLEKEGFGFIESKEKIEKLLKKSKYLVAHNGLNFDFKILDSYFYIFDKILLDTLEHIPLLNKSDSQKLKYKCFDNNIQIDNKKLHRALIDVEYTYKLFFNYGFDNILRNSKKEKYMLIATGNTFEIKDKIKSCGFFFDGEEKHWYKIIYREDLKKETEGLGFQIDVINV